MKSLKCIIEDLTSENLKLFKENTELRSRVNGWIPVGERLPNGTFHVIVTNGQHTDFGYYDATTESWRRCIFWDVTHWMPLPQPPKKEEV